MRLNVGGGSLISLFGRVFFSEQAQGREPFIFTVYDPRRAEGHGAPVSHGETCRAVLRRYNGGQADAAVVRQIVELLPLHGTVEIDGVARQDETKRHAIGQPIPAGGGQDAIGRAA